MASSKAIPLPGQGKQKRPKKRSLAVSMNPEHMSGSDFHVLYAIKNEKLESKYRDTKSELVWLSLYNVPNYLRLALERVLAMEVPHPAPTEEGIGQCIYYGKNKLYALEIYIAWDQISHRSIIAEYDDDEDSDDVAAFRGYFRISIPDLNTGTRQVNFRLPEGLRAEVNWAAKVLGLPGHVLAQVLWMDGLRQQGEITDRHRQAMDRVVDEFYRLVERRTRRLRNLLKAVGVDS